MSLKTSSTCNSRTRLSITCPDNLSDFCVLIQLFFITFLLSALAVIFQLCHLSVHYFDILVEYIFGLSFLKSSELIFHRCCVFQNIILCASNFKLTSFIVPTFDTKVTEYLCSGWVFFSSDKFRLFN